MKRITLAVLSVGALNLPLGGVLVDFEDLTPPAGAYYNGADSAGGFTSGGLRFDTNYDAQWMTWDGFAYSSLTGNSVALADVEAGTFLAYQYQAAPGAAHSGEVYAIGFVGFFLPPTIHLPAGLSKPLSMQVSNGLYAWASMTHGDSFARQFGEGDWFLLTVTGHDANGKTLGSVDFNLADMRGEDAYILDEWTTLDLSPLGAGVRSLTFSMNSSDVGDWGMNTPAYFAIDDLETVEPAPGETWAGFPIANGAWVDTGATGWFGIAADDPNWVWFENLGLWAYVPDDSQAAIEAGEGFWTYASR